MDNFADSEKRPILQVRRGLDLIEIVFQLAILSVGYLVGAAGTAFAVRMVNVSLLEFNPANLFVLTLPLVCAVIAESFTHLWLRTPGSLGLGGLNVFFPMLVAGVMIALMTMLASKFILPFDASLPRSSEYLSAWILLALIASAGALALWRYWPAPQAKLF